MFCGRSSQHAPASSPQKRQNDLAKTSFQLILNTTFAYWKLTSENVNLTVRFQRKDLHRKL